MSSADPSPRRSAGDSARAVGIRAIEWKIAWRHLRRGGREETPAWVRVSLLGAIYMTLVGIGFLLYAAAGVEVAPGAQLFSGADLSPSQRWFGVFGAAGLFFGVLWLVVSLLASFFNLLATIITVSVLVGCMALVVVLSLMTGLEADLRDKILNQKAHVLVSAEDGNRFSDYEGLVTELGEAPGVAGASPFVEGEVMAKSGMNRQGGVLRGVRPERIVEVSNLDEIIRRGNFEWLSDPAAIVGEDPFADDEGTPWRLRHLEGERPPEAAPTTRPRAWAIGAPLALMLLALGIGLRKMPWRQWLAPTLLVVLAAAGVLSLAPSDPTAGGLSLGAEAAGAGSDKAREDEDGGPGADDPMLERLKPKPVSGVGDLPAPTGMAKAGQAKVAPMGGGLLRDIKDVDGAEGFGAHPTAAAAPAKVVVSPVDIPPIDFKARRPVLLDDDGWEDPLAELGLPEAIDPPPRAGLSQGTPPKKVTIHIGGSPSDRDTDDGGDWEDPLEELNIELDPDPKPDPTKDPSENPNKTGPTGEGSGAPATPERPKGVPDAILIGNELAMELAVRVGSRVQLITPIGRMTPAGRVPGLLATRVGGIFYSGNYEYDRKNIYAPLGVVQRFLRTGDRVSGIEIKLDDVTKIGAGKAAVLAVLERHGRSGELRAETWEELNRNLFSAMLLEKIAMGVALLFVVLVASFGILASNLMSVIEKAKEISILKAMGAPDLQIQRIFVAEGLCVGLIGAAGGLLVGLGLCLGLDRFGFPFDENVYYIEQLPVVVNPLEVAVVGLAALGIIWASSLYPARVASRMRPVDGLRENDR